MESAGVLQKAFFKHNLNGSIPYEKNLKNVQDML